MTIAGPIAGRPLPLIDSDNAAFFEGTANGALMIQQCVETGAFQHYPRYASIRTGGPVSWKKVSGRGRIYSFSIVRQNYAQPALHALAPYVVALIDLDEGVRMMGNIVHCPVEDVRIDARVQARMVCVDEASNLHLPFWTLVQTGGEP